MKILITGAGGFLGRRIVERLLAHGETEVRCMVRVRSKAEVLERSASAFPDASVEMFVADLRHPAQLQASLDGVKLVIHAAASLSGSPAEMFADSVVASRNLLDAIVARPAADRPRVVLISSFGVLGAALLKNGETIDEETSLETQPARRDLYSYAKLRQEQMFREYGERYGLDLVVLRPGVIYGPGGGHFSNRVGLPLFGRFLHLGGSNLLPLTFVDNCAEAVVVAALNSQSAGQTYHVVDDDLPTSRQYLALYRKHVRKMSVLPIPRWLLRLGSRLVERYSERSKGQMPAVFTPYKTQAMWGGHHFTNARLKAIGWRQIVPTSTALERTLQSFKRDIS